MRYIYFISLSLIILMVSCSSSKTAKREVIVPEGEPEWLYSPSSGCDKNKEICTSGEGTNFKSSDANARKSLASIFETKINSSFRFTKHNFSDSEVVEMSEMVSNKIDEDVTGILKASYIKERFKKDDLAFSWAAIDKQKSSKVLRAELKRLDDEISHFFNQRNRLYLKKLNVLYYQRELLNEKLVILGGSGVSSSVSLAQINMIKFKSKGGAKIGIKTLTNVPELIVKKTEAILTDVGYKIIKKNDINYLVQLTYIEKEEYLNVPGFKKWTFELGIESKSNAGKKLGGMVINVISNGRTKKDAFAKVRNKIVKEFEDNLEKLNLN